MTSPMSEKEAGEEKADIARSRKPQSIRIDTRQFTLRGILNMIDDGAVFDLAPDVQRRQAWDIVRKSRLIESVLLQIPLPTFYFAQDPDGRMRVVDGLQRLSIIHDFVRGGPRSGFPLTGLEYLDDSLEGQHFEVLPAPWKRRIRNTAITAHVIDPTTPPDVRFDIIRRINGGAASRMRQNHQAGRRFRSAGAGDSGRSDIAERMEGDPRR